MSLDPSASREARRDLLPLGGRELRPLGDFGETAMAAAARIGVNIDDAHFDAGAFHGGACDPSLFSSVALTRKAAPAKRQYKDGPECAAEHAARLFADLLVACELRYSSARTSKPGD
jgi:hypothetical protein